MTNPSQDAHDALALVGQMLTGTKILQEEPGVVYDLSAQQARPQDAQAIDQFMQTLDAERQVQIARASVTAGGNGYINLDQNQQRLLQAEGYQYQDILYNHSPQAATQASQIIQHQTNGQYTAKLNSDGTLALKNGQIVPVALEKQQPQPGGGGGGLFSSVGHFFGGIGHAIKTGAIDTFHAMNRALNLANTTLDRDTNDLYKSVGDLTHGDFSKMPGDLWNAATQMALGSTPDQIRNQISDLTQGNTAQATRSILGLGGAEQDMQNQGYDPNSFWSMMAYQSSGHNHTDLGPLNDKYGADKVSQAIQFLNNPKGYRATIEGDPNSYTTNADGSKILTPDATARLKYLDSPEFETIARQVNAHDTSVGNDIMNQLGVDPVKHATSYTLGSAGINLAASFAIDPTNAVFAGMKAAKLATVGIDTLGDGDKAAQILMRQSKLPWVTNIQRGWQKAIDLGSQMREAHAAGDTARMAQLNAQFNAELPGLAPLVGEFSGLSRTRYVFDPVSNAAHPELYTDDGIQSLAHAADWLGSKEGFNLLREGRAATQTGVMPGALSAVGYKKLKGITASWMTGLSASRASKAAVNVLSRATADPALGERLVTDGVLRRLLPEADDAVDSFTGATLAERQASDQFALTPAGRGDLARGLRGGKTDTALDQLINRSAVDLRAIVTRGRLAVQRLSTLLPRNTLLDATDTDSALKVRQYAMTYLNRGDANTLAALWATGDGAARKQIVHGLLDQVSHAAGLGKTQSGRNFMDAMHAVQENYSAAGDELMVNGQNMALTQGQTQNRWILPTFTATRKNAARLGLLDATFGRAANAQQADNLMSYWKSAMLLAPKTAPRNMAEGWLRALVEGQAGKAIQTKALMTARNKELFALRLDQSNARVAELKNAYEEAMAGGRFKDAEEIANGSLLSGEELGRSRFTYRLSELAPLYAIGRSYRAAYLKHMSPDMVNAILDRGPEDVAEIARGLHSRILESDMGLKNAAKQATAIAKAGYGPATLGAARRRAMAASAAREDAKDKIVSWASHDLGGVEGTTRYANELARRVNAMPETARAVLDRLENHGDLQSVIDAMTKESRDTAFGKVYFPDPDNEPNVARWATSPEEAEAGKTPFAQKLVNEFSYLLHGQNGEYQKLLADEIRNTGKAPDANWIADKITGANRPESALAPDVISMPNGGIAGLSQALQDTTGAAFQWLVERTIQRTTSMPIYWANYAVERVGLNRQVDKMVAQGFSHEAASKMASELAERRAMVRTEQIIDDPGQKTQFDVIARNFFPWSRAVNAMIRRWGAGLWQNPANARKLMLAYEGAQHSGLVYNNAYGEPTFTYPGSGVFGMMMHELSKVPGFGGIVQFPMSSDLTGSVVMAVPGADNPFRMSMGPMMSVPFREVYKHLLPTSWQGNAMKVDEFINGPIGTGETFGQLVPSYVKRFYDAFQPADKNAAAASAVNGAIAQLAAAGYIPPPNASTDQLNQFRARVQTQAKNQMFFKAVFGLFAPSAPSSTEYVKGNGPDFAWQMDGVKNLSDEFKSILNDTGGDYGRALAVFTALHPDEVIYKGAEKETKLPSALTVPTTEGTTKGVTLPDTAQAFHWMMNNRSFMSKYQSVSAYFLPEASVNEPFSDAAYKAQLEFGLRVRKTPEQFLNDIYVRHAENQYYPIVKKYDNVIAAAQLQGNTSAYSYWTQEKSLWENEYKNLNPLLAAKQRADGLSAAQNQLVELRQMVQHNEVPDGNGPLLGSMIQSYDNYESFIHSQSSHSNAGIHARSQALDQLNAWATKYIQGTQLQDLWNGVFGALNTNLTRLGQAAP